MNTRVWALASALLAHGLTRADKLACLGFNGCLGVESLFAAPLIGAAAVPIKFRLS